MRYSFRACDALWIDNTGPRVRPDQRHLFLVLKDEDALRKVLVVPVCTRRRPKDYDFVVASADHEDLSEESYLAFDQVVLRSGGDLEAMLRRGRGCLRTTAFSVEFYERACGALRAHDLTPGWARSFLGKV